MAADLSKTDSHLAARCAAIASLGAGAIHVAVIPAHWSNWVPAGLFFGVLAVFQVGWAYVVWSRPTPWLLAAGIATNALAAALWVTAHTRGIPFGPGAGRAEAADAAAICVLLLQCYVVMGSALAWSRLSEARNVPRFNRAVILLGANTAMVVAVTAGLVSALAGHHPDPAEAGLPMTDMELHISGGGHHHE
ncbi:MAG: hypothetical protein WCH82_03170 [Mycobacteriaceae bacterium]